MFAVNFYCLFDYSLNSNLATKLVFYYMLIEKIVSCTKLEQPLNALSPIEVTDDKIEICCKDEQP